MYRKFSISRKVELQRLINGEKRQTCLERKLYFSFVINLMVNSQEIIENHFLYFYWGLIVFSIPLFDLNTGIKWCDFSKDHFGTLWISANWNIKAVHSCDKESKSHKNNKRNFVLFRQSRVSQGQVCFFQSFKTFFLLFNQNLFTILKFQFGLEIFDFGIFWGWKICQVFFGWLDLSREFVGLQNNLTCGLFSQVIKIPIQLYGMVIDWSHL